MTYRDDREALVELVAALKRRVAEAEAAAAAARDTSTLASQLAEVTAERDRLAKELEDLRAQRASAAVGLVSSDPVALKRQRHDGPWEALRPLAWITCLVWLWLFVGSGARC